MDAENGRSGGGGGRGRGRKVGCAEKQLRRLRNWSVVNGKVGFRIFSGREQ